MGKLGDTLRERRTTLGLTLGQAEEATRIRYKMLKALEEGDYGALPDPGYVRGYISSYARLLELDPAALMAMYKAETGAGRYHKIDLPQIEEAVARTGEQHAVPLRIAITVVVVIAVIALAIWGFMRLTRPDEVPPPEPVAPAETSATTTETAAPVEEEPEEPASETVAAVPFTVEIRVSSEGASWLKITVDQKPAYEGMLAGGQSKKFEVSESASIQIGKPEYVTVLRDGKAVTVKGSSVSLTAEPSR